MLRRNVRTISIDPFVHALACAAVHPDLRNILVFNAPYADLTSTAVLLSHMLYHATGRTVKRITLGSSERDEDLWGSLSLHMLDTNAQSSPITWARGLLTGAWDDPEIRLVIIPDLAKVSLAAIRACVMLVGADIAHLERHGHKKRWKPDMCWLANCASSDIGSISPHLLDRFSLRLNWRDPGSSDSVAQLLKHVMYDISLEDAATVTIPPLLQESIERGATFRSKMSDEEVLKRVLYHIASLETSTPRREIALARLAVAVAQLEGSQDATLLHVDMAAYLMGMASAPIPQHSYELSAGPDPLETHQADIVPASAQPLVLSETVRTEVSSEVKVSIDAPLQGEVAWVVEPVYAPDIPIIMEKTILPVEPYPEDKAPVARDAYSLRLPMHRSNTRRSGWGAIIGVEQTKTLQDLALVSTLLTAAPFQPIRRKNRSDIPGRLLLLSSDLRSYRREPAAEHMLLVLVDYTSLRDCAWQQSLLPYLRQAYVERASIGIIQVGAANAAHELRAELVSARSILVPRIGMALETVAGRATPLAHGFDIALNTLRHALQHGRDAVQQVLFVVISDGRGNVPLEMSRQGCIIPPVNREGIEDTLHIAQRLSMLKDVHTFYLNPQPRQHQTLPLALAHALGAEVRPIQRSTLEGEG